MTGNIILIIPESYHSRFNMVKSAQIALKEYLISQQFFLVLPPVLWQPWVSTEI